MQKLSGLFLFAVLISGTFSSGLAFAQVGPIAQDDFYFVDEDTLLTVSSNGVLLNDTNTNSTTFLAIIQTTTGFGTLNLNSNGTFTYLPNLNFASVDSFTYVANNGTHNSNNATVTISVNPINDAPVAQNDSVQTQQNVQIRIDVLENDSDVEDDSLNIILMIDPLVTNGTAIIDNSEILFTPNTDFVGRTSFSYMVSDGDKTSNLANVTITVNPINEIPDAQDDTATTSENTSIIIPVLNNDIDDDSISINSVTQGTNGTVTTNGTTITYTPDTDFSGTDSFTYTITDGVNISNSATVTVTVTSEPSNDDVIEQLLVQIQDLLDKVLNLENEITILQDENAALILRNNELEAIIANGTSTNDDDDENNDDEVDNNNDKVIVCHKGKKSISISENAVSAHLKHGDEIGKCDDSDISSKKEIKNQIKELKNEYKEMKKELKQDFKTQEKDLKKQLKDLKKDKKSKDKDHDDDDNEDDDEDDDD